MKSVWAILAIAACVGGVGCASNPETGVPAPPVDAVRADCATSRALERDLSLDKTFAGVRQVYVDDRGEPCVFGGARP